MNTWITRGTKPERVASGAVLAALEGGFLAWLEGRDPVVGAATRAVAAGAAMSKHRLADRHDAHARYRPWADEAATKIQDLTAQRAEQASTRKYNEVMAAWATYVQNNGCDPDEIRLTSSAWNALSVPALDHLVRVANARGIAVHVN